MGKAALYTSVPNDAGARKNQRATISKIYSRSKKRKERMKCREGCAIDRSDVG